MNTDIKSYFDHLAKQRVKKTINAYYWKEITRYIEYFTHEYDSVLEIGCGSGDLIAKIKGRHKTGIDFSEYQIQWAKEKYGHLNIEFLVMDANDLQLNKTYDLIIISNVIGFVDDIQKLFEQLHKVCHPRTKIIVQYYNSFWEPFIKLAEIIGIKKKAPIQNWLTSSDVNNLLYVAGFEVYRNSRQTLFPFYIPLFSSFINQFVAKLPFIRFFNINHFSFARPMPCNAHTDEYSVSVVIPARNEAGNIENAIKRLPKLGKHTEIIFVEGNSTDNTWDTIIQVAEKYKHTHDIKYFKQPGKGKADAVREGFKHATGDILMILDADLTVPPEDLPKFYNAIAQNKGDFINGTRLVYPMEKGAMRFLNYLGNHFFSWTFSFLLEQRFKDTLCGTKVIFKKDYEKLIKNREYFGDFDPFGDFDLLFGAHKLNLKIVEIPIRYRERTYGSTNISRFKHGWILLKMCAFASRKCKFI
ncbi:MAG: bifunctional class I SAM-dependent methyltransferase/glycosyltransferase family 2 protein [Bacteroidia bacterium]